MEVLTLKQCCNCIHMPVGSGYFCEELKRTFDGHEIDKGFVPCKGEYFKHYASENPIEIHVVDRDANIYAVLLYDGEEVRREEEWLHQQSKALTI